VQILQLLKLINLNKEFKMKIHHLNCISSCPLGGKLMDEKDESLLARGHLTNHCQLIETSNELILVDTGFGLQEVHNPHSRLSEFFLKMLKPEFKEELTAIRQIEKMGYDPRDVRHIVLTHLDFDHAGGLDDFPEAKVHMLKEEADYAVQQKTWLDRQRFRPQQWGTKNNWITYERSIGESWFGFEKVSALQGLPPEIALIPLVGHTFGHAGVTVNRGDKWLINAGDAYFYHAEMNFVNPHCTPGLKMYQMMMDKNRKARIWNQERLRNLRQMHTTEVDIFCSHDLVEFEYITGRSPEISVEFIKPEFREFTACSHPH
jgi:glyoxylase-like metal-dependent hydrolase (beta-lactamase superfamily II)